MKKLFIMRGPSLCGKTTLIEELGLKENTISPDDIRKMYFGMEIYQDTTKIIKKDSYKIFSKLYEIIEQRMEYGLLTIIDHSNLLEVNIEKYKNLCYKYGYECIVVNFKTPLNELLERNSKLAYPLDEEEIKKEYEESISQKIPNFCKVVFPERMSQEISFKFQDCSRYKKVVHIGDIHGCFDILKSFLKEMSFDTLYIFHGDYIDRGLQNVEVLKFLISIKRKPNVILLKGNHELNLIKYVNGEEIYSKTFQTTRAEIEKSNISIKDLKDLCRTLKNFYAYSYKGQKVLCTHGGISSLKNIETVSEYSFIMGSGDIEKTNIDKEFNENVQGVVQIHGHRNPFNVEINEYSNSFNLEGAVEEGGELRTIELIDKRFCPRAYKNEFVKK